MTADVVNLSKKRQARKSGKPDLEAARKELEEQDLLPGEPEEPPKPSALILDAGDERMLVRELPIDQIYPGDNPRVETDPVALKELTASVKEIGILQPPIVRPMDDGRYQLIAGWRRFNAAKAAKLTTIPVIVRSAADQDAYVASLIENLQREDLDPIDEAHAFQKLLETPGADGKKMTQGDLAKRVGKSQPYISNQMRLLQLPESLQQKVSSGELSIGSAKAIVTLPKASQEKIAKDATSKKQTTQQVEQSARWERDRVESEKKRESERQGKITSFLTALEAAKAAGTITDDTDVAVYGTFFIEPLHKAGWKNVREHTTSDTARNGFPCDDVAFLLDQPYGAEEASLRSICTNREHPTAHDRDEREKAEAERKRQLESVNEARTQALTYLTAGKAPIAEDGLRLALLGWLTARRGYYGTDENLIREFMGRHDRMWTSSTTGQIWDCIVSLPIDAVVQELLTPALVTVFTNVYADGSRGPNALFHEVRQFFVDNAKVDESIVWGGHEPVVTDVDVDEEDEDGPDVGPHLFQPDLDAEPVASDDDEGEPLLPCIVCGEFEDDHAEFIVPGQEALAIGDGDTAPEALGEATPEAIGEDVPAEAETETPLVN